MKISDEKHQAKALLLRPLLSIVILACLSIGVFLIVSEHYMKYLIVLLIIILIPVFISVFVILKRNRFLTSEVMTREEIEENLKKSETKYRSIFENAIEGIFQSMADGRMISVNHALARMAGYKSPQEMLESMGNIGQHYADPHERIKMLQIINEKGFVNDYIAKMKPKDGDLFWASISARIVKDEKGNTLYYEGSIEDITKRKEAEDAVIYSRNLLNNVLQAASEFSIIATDPNGIITVFNRGAELMLSYSSEEVTGRHTALILHDDLEVAARGRELTAKLGYPVDGFRVFATKPELEGPETREWTYVRKDGTTLPVSLVVSAMRSGSNEITGYLGIATDLTKRKSTEVELRMLASIVRHSSELVGVAQMDGQMVFINEAGSKMLGIDPEDIEKINVMQFVPDHLKGLIEEQAIPRLMDGGIWEGDLQCINLKTGAVIDVHSLNFTIDDPNALYKKYHVNISLDISLRKQAEKMAREKEERLSIIAKNLPGVVFQSYKNDSGEWVTSYASERLNELFGPTIDTEAMFHKFVEHIHEEDRERFMASVEKAVEMCIPWDFEGRYIKHPGDTIWFHGLATPMRHEDRMGLDGILMDITEHKNAEEMSRSSEDKFTNIFMMAPDGISITRMTDGLIIDTNIGFGEISGWKRSEVIGRTSLDVNFWADPADRAFLVDELKAGRDVMQHEFQFRRKDGALRNGIYSARPIRIAGEACLVFVMQDITQRKETERILRENEERLGSIAGNLPGVVFQFCARDNGEWNPTYNSDRMMEIFGLSLETAKEFTAFLSCVHEEDRERFIASIRTAVEACSPWDFEGRFIKPSGKMIWFHGLSTPTRYEDYVMFDGIMLDVTERKQAEEMSRLSEKKFTNIFMMAPDMVAITRIEDGLIADVNMGFEEITGWKRNEVIGRTSYSLNFWVNPEDRALMVEKLKAGSDVVRREIPFRRKDGSLRTGIYSARFIQIASEMHLIFVMQDITERKQAEEALKKSETLLNSILEASSAGIGLLVDRALLKINHSLCRITGYSEEELLGRTTQHLYFDDEEYNRMGQLYKEMGRDGLGMSEARLRRKDGSIKNVLICISPVNPNDLKVGVIATVLDITERKQIEDALQKTASELQLIFKNMFNAFIIWESVFDENGRYVSFRFGFFNDAYASIANVKREEVAGKDVFEVWPDTEQSWVEAYGKVAVTGNPYTFDMYHTPTKGWYHCNAYRPADSPMQVCVIFEDITARKHAEEALMQNEKQFRSLFESSPAGIALLKDRIFQKINSRLCEITGYSFDELTGRNIRILFADDDEYIRVGKELYDIMKRDDRGVIESRIRHKSGRMLDIYASGSTLDPQNRSAGTVFTIVDMTDRKQLEEEHRKLEQQLSQSQKMDAIGQLAGGIAHDFNNILMGIQGNASMSMMEFSPGHPQYQRMSRIEEYVKRGANLTKHLLGFAREGKYEVKTLSANDLLKKSSQIFIETRKEIDVNFELQDDLHSIEADAGQLEQVFLNIFINAGHAMPGGGRLHIQTSNIILQEKDAMVLGISPGDYVKISISDTGIGMDESILKKIFEPFFTTKSEQGGTGLGLASAYGIIRNHGGLISAYSEPGQGATFNIYLPSSDIKLEKEKDQVVVKSLFLGSGGILVIDDEHAILEIASEILKMLGYTVYQAENAQDAVSIYQKKRDGIDLVILDMILKGTSGSEVLKMLKECNPDVKVILSSGYGLQGEVQKVMQMGCVGFIQKPYNFTDLSRVVHQALEHTEKVDSTAGN